MTQLLRGFSILRPGPALALCALALLTTALRPPAAAAVPAGVPLAWGRNHGGQLGNGTLSDSATPMQVLNISNVVAVSGGDKHSLALRADGTVWSWGANFAGQLGNGTYTDSTVPVPVSNLPGIVAIYGGFEHCLALKSDGTVWTWGRNYEGQLGIGVMGGTRNIPVQVPNLAGVVAIAGSAGGHYSLALKADGTVWAWGYNASGQLGEGTFSNRDKPTRVTNLPLAVAIATGNNHSLALAADGTVWAWGLNTFGQLGNGTFTPSPPLGHPHPCAGFWPHRGCRSRGQFQLQRSAQTGPDHGTAHYLDLGPQ